MGSFVVDAIKKLQLSAEADLGLHSLDFAPAERPVFPAANDVRAKSLWRAEQVAKSFGTDVIYVNNRTPHLFDFAGSCYDGKLFINVNAHTPHHVALGHELLHFIRRKDESAYQRLHQGLLANVAYNADPRKLDEFRFVAGIEPARTNDYTKEEFVAELLGRRFGEPEFLRDVVKAAGAGEETPTWRQALADIVALVIEFISRLREYVVGRVAIDQPISYTQNNDGMFATDFNVDDFVVDLDAARGVLTNFMTQMASISPANVQGAEPPPAVRRPRM